MLQQAIEASDLLADHLSVGVVNARFAKPIDEKMVEESLADGKFVVTIEEGAEMGGFGSALLECAVKLRLDTRGIRVLALPDEFIEHGDRADLLNDHGLSPKRIAETCRDLANAEPALVH